MQFITGLGIGLLFGLGLFISGMGNPHKVQQFLDLAGNWDPSLALVMVGAIAVAFIPFQMAKKQHITTWSKTRITLPSATQIDKSLVVGSLVFGVGWGLVGICPGPAVALIGTGTQIIWWFVPAMLLGMWLARYVQIK